MASSTSVAEQRQFLDANYDANTQPQDGEKWYPVDAEWLDQLLSFVNDKPAADGSPSTKPGPIDNSKLTDATINIALKRGLVRRLAHCIRPQLLRLFPSVVVFTTPICPFAG